MRLHRSGAGPHDNSQSPLHGEMKHGDQTEAAMEQQVLTPDEAARLVGCKNAAQFLREVRAGHWPKPLPIKSRPLRWSRAAIERRLAQMSGFPASSDAAGTEPSWRQELREWRA